MSNVLRLLLLALLLPPLTAKTQALYFPPTAVADTNWARLTPQSLNWNGVALDSALDFLRRRDTKAFLMLQDGRLVVEKYYGTFTRDSTWYWASAGKSLTATLVGLAQQDGRLQISNPTAQYLGAGWSSCPAAKEQLITVRHQLTMTTGLNDNLPPTPTVPDPDNCLTPACLQYLADAGTRWAYHNAPYRLLHQVLEAATGQNINLYTATRLGNRIGGRGLWFNGVYYSRPRDMARFGLFMLAKGSWNGTRILTDTTYFQQMVSRSQAFNHSYGYLWWLNGQGSYMLPQSQLVFNTDLMPAAPDDMIAALGKNDQKIYVVPSRRLVVVRMGNSAGQSMLALSSFDNDLWTKLMAIFPTPTGLLPDEVAPFALYPNPATEQVRCTSRQANRVQLVDMLGRSVRETVVNDGSFSVRGLPAGLYLARLFDDGGKSIGKLRLEVR